MEVGQYGAYIVMLVVLQFLHLVALLLFIAVLLEVEVGHGMELTVQVEQKVKVVLLH